MELIDTEKNEVLAKWLGFVFNKSGKGWYYPDGTFSMSARPDFLHSLDAQAKWLYPKIYEVKLHQRSNIMNGQWCAEVFLHTPSGCTYRDTPAEAFVDALLYVIKEERSNG